MTTKTPTTRRRTVLRNVATVACGSALVTRTVRGAQAERAGKVVFTYDDGPVEDYTHTYRRAHRKEGVPGCSAVPSGRVGEGTGMSGAQLRELESAGWEIMSHTVRHRALTEITVTRDVAPGDRNVYVESNIHGKVPGDRLVITDGDRTETVTVDGRGSGRGGEYVRLAAPVQRSFDADDGVVERYVDETIRSALGDSKAQLEEHGVTVTNIVMPYGGYGPRTRELVSDHYTAVANGGLAIGGRGQVHDPADITLPNLSRAMFEYDAMTEDELGSFLDRVADSGALGILGGHSALQDEIPPERVRTAIRMAKERSVEIVTLREALADFGVTGDPDGGGATRTTGVDGRTNDGTADPAAGDGRATTDATTRTNQPGFGWLAALAGVGGAAALRRVGRDR